jgi:uncharacterized membrane protein
MRERYIPALVMLLAGAITSIINILNKVDQLEGSKRLLLVLIIFYFVGVIAKAIIKKALAPKPIKEDKEVTEEDNKEEEIQPEEKTN